jgi:hypothetical protein
MVTFMKGWYERENAKKEARNAHQGTIVNRGHHYLGVDEDMMDGMEGVISGWDVESIVPNGESRVDSAEDDVRIKRIAELLKSVDVLSTKDKQDMFDQAQEVIQHNWNHFYNGNFEAVLWKELTEMMDGIESTG